MKNTFKRTLIFAMVFALVMTVFPVIETEAKTTKVTVTTKSALYREMKKSTAAVITYKNKKTTKLTISEVGVPSNKTLVLNCKKAEVTNKAKFKTVKIKAAKKYTEKVSGNTIEVLNSTTLLSISKKMKVTKLTVPTKKFMDNVKLGKKAKILNLVYADAKVTTTPEPTNVEPTKTEPTKTPTNVPAPTVTETPTVTVAPTPVVTPTVQPTVTQTPVTQVPTQTPTATVTEAPYVTTLITPSVQPTPSVSIEEEFPNLSDYARSIIVEERANGKVITNAYIYDVDTDVDLYTQKMSYWLCIVYGNGLDVSRRVTCSEDPKFFEDLGYPVPLWCLQPTTTVTEAPTQQPTVTESSTPTVTETVTTTVTPEVTVTEAPTQQPTITEAPTTSPTPTVDPTAEHTHTYVIKTFNVKFITPAVKKSVGVSRCSSPQNDGTVCHCNFYDVVKNEDGSESVVYWTQEQIDAHVIAHMDKGEMGNFMTTAIDIIETPETYTDGTMPISVCSICGSPMWASGFNNDTYFVEDFTPID